MKPQTVPMSLRLSPELAARLEKCAQNLKQKKHTLAQAAIEAAVEAIEQNDYQLVVPIRFDVTHVAVERLQGKSSSSSSKYQEGVGPGEQKAKRQAT